MSEEGPGLLEGLLARARRLEERAHRFSASEPALRLNLRLRQVLEKDPAILRPGEQPVVIALVGGTGSGKSSLFNALIGREEASPTSVVRACTRVPHVACSPRDFSLLGHLRKLNPVHVANESRGLVLVDTPDLDSVETANRDITRRVIEAADVLVYVTIPDRVGDFVMNETVRASAERKRWFFVLNKADLHPGGGGEARNEFDRRLRELGFEPDDRVRFWVSAKKPDEFEFAALARSVSSARAAEAVRALRRDGVLGLLQHATVEESVRTPLMEQSARLRERGGELENRARAVYRRALETESATRAMRLLVRNRTWQSLASYSGWIMGMVVWAKCRGAMLSSAWQLGRMATRGPSLFGLIWVAAASLASAVRGVLPLRNLRQALDSGAERELQAVSDDVRRVLEDEGFAHGILAETNAASPAEDEVFEAWVQAVRSVPVVGGNTARAMETTSRRRTLADDLLGPVETAIDNAAEQAARAAARWPVVMLANALPTLVLAHAAWRMGHAWYFAEWLPGSFYGLAISIFLLSLIPGYVLLVLSVRAGTRVPEAETVLGTISRPGVTADLRAVWEELEEIARDAAALDALAGKMREALAEELPLESFGAKVRPPA